MKTFAGRLPDSATTPVLGIQDSEDYNSGPDVVICAHPNQDAFVRNFLSLWFPF